MSAIQIVRSQDLRRLVEAGYHLRITDANILLVRGVPYVNSKREVAYGALACSLDLAGDITVRPQYHTIMFIGDYPCDAAGNELAILRHTSGTFPVGDGLVAQHSFSRKPKREYYEDYYEKITHYVALIGQPVAAIDPDATARSGQVIEPEVEDNSPFNYLDTASSRAQINSITAKLAQDAVAIVGLGGTGSYVLDLVAKTPVRSIHLFDADRFLTHNAFRAPGAPAIEELRLQPLKVDYLKGIYSRMHRGIVAHPDHIGAENVDKLQGMSFVFLCMEGGKEKRAIVDKLEALGTPFVDVGMGLYSKHEKVGGIMRTVLSLQDGREAARAKISFAADDADNAYDQNIQVADLNALNACLAVIAWKKTCGFYFDQGGERFNSYTVGNSLLVKGNIV